MACAARRVLLALPLLLVAL
uniref:Uncharacterized protein n=1 Tax=Arundo donax TaxID=35708 RepID=A0A0A9FKE8_ARUDO